MASPRVRPACLVLLLLSGPFALDVAAPADARAGSPEAACLGKSLRAATRVARAQDADVRRCLADRARGRSEGPEADACLLADAKGKVARARAKAARIDATTCETPPAFGYAGAVSASRAAATEQLGIAHELFGASPGTSALPSAVDREGARCQTAVYGAASKLFAREVDEFGRCVRVGLRSGTIIDGSTLATCLDEVAADAGGRLGRLRAALARVVDRRCGGVDLDAAFPGACAGDGDLASCVAVRSACRSCLLASETTALGVSCDAFDDGVENASCLRCNGAASLCDRPFDEVVFPTSHNAMSNAAEGWLAPNQAATVPAQLDAGIRSLMLDAWYWGGDAVLCHGGEVFPGVGCDITGQKSLDAGLAEIDAWLDAHPREVLSIIFESYVSEADMAADFAASGLLDHVHAQPAGAPWPTLRELIAADTRMIVLTDDSGATLPWHHYVWAHAWETHFSAQTPADFSCAPNRGSTSHPLFIFNHFLTAPFASPGLASQVNFDPLFIDRARTCQAAHDDLPNFVTVDFENIGDVYEVVRALNGLPE